MAEQSESTAIPSAPIRLLDSWIAFWLSVFDLVGSLFWLGRDTFEWMWRAFVLRRVRIGSGAITAQLVRVGVRSISIVMLVYLTTSLLTSLLMNWYNSRAAIKER